MAREVFLRPIGISDIDFNSSRSQEPSPIELQEALCLRGLATLKIQETLHGGYMSQVYGATYDESPVVVKHSEDTFPFDPTAFFISRHIQDTEAKVLLNLKNSNAVRVPKIICHFNDITTTVMEDLRPKEFTLMSKIIVAGHLPMESARPIGRALAALTQESRTWKLFETDQTAIQNIYDRGLELRMAYPNNQTQYKMIEHRFTHHNQGWIWVDGTPKNVMITPSGEAAFIDFGLSCYGDQQHTLPNFLSHIAVYFEAGILDKKQSLQYIRDCIDEYCRTEHIDESSFCQYFGMEILHRSMGKRIQGVERIDQKLALTKIGLRIFDENVESINTLMRVLQQ